MSRSGLLRLHGPHLRRAAAAAGAGAFLVTAATAAWMPGAAQARASALSFTVNTTADAHDAHPGDGQCADSTGQCSLRAALEEADASPSGSSVTIAVPAGTYALTLGSLTAGSASVPLTITVDGAGAASTVVKATGKFRVMTVTAHATASLGNLQVTGGKAGANSYGGGIFSQGKLTLSGDTLTGNTAGRGAIDNFGGSLTLKFSTVSGAQGLITGSGFATATGTILAGTGATPNCAGPLSETVGYNLSTDSSCGLTLKTDLTKVDPMLGPLADNGGPTMTLGLPRSSPAVNAGGLPASSSCPASDQRGESRPWGPACDIGAFELH